MITKSRRIREAARYDLKARRGHRVNEAVSAVLTGQESQAIKQALACCYMMEYQKQSRARRLEFVFADTQVGS